MLIRTFGEHHITHQLIGDHNPDVVVIEFQSEEIAGRDQASELREELGVLIRRQLSRRFVIDFGNVRMMASTAIGEIVFFARQVGRLAVCNMRESLRRGAILRGLDRFAEFAADREAAIVDARRGPLRGDGETADSPAWQSESAGSAECPAGTDRAGVSDVSRPSSTRSTNERGAGQEPAAQRSVRNVSIAAGSTLDDFGGRSDAPGG
jgi:anti-anti-sigma regulatory factor